MAVYAIDVAGIDLATRQRLQVLREAFEARRVLTLDYDSLENVRSQRRVRPLGVFFWDAVWTLAAWCELRNDFRSFRVDRIVDIAVLDERFRDRRERRWPICSAACAINELGQSMSATRIRVGPPSRLALAARSATAPPHRPRAC